MRADPASLRLLADIGGTNARFALAGPDGVRGVRVLRAADHAGLADAAEAYLAMTGADARPRTAAFAVASPVTGDQVALTNSPWSFSITALRERLGLAHLAVVNDFVAVARAVPHLEPGDRVQVGPAIAAGRGPIVVLGPGTGLGVAALVPHAGTWLAVASEGGHATLAPADAREAAVVERLRAGTRTGHVSAERALCGPGLVRLRAALAEIDGIAVDALEPNQITQRAIAGGDPLSRATLEMFCAMLGGFAGNLALSFGALGGVFIGGGIVPNFTGYFARSAFRDRFEAKGRFLDYQRRIPTCVITHPQPAFLGLATLAEAPD